MGGRVRLVAWSLTLTAACGGGDHPPAGPQPLVPDPAVQVGCVPFAAGTTRAKVVACGDELVAGRLAGGRIGDFVLENDKVQVIVRGPGEGLYLAGMAGGGIVDAASRGGEDLVKEIQPAVDFAVGAYDELVITEAGDDGPAEIVVRGPATGLDLVTAVVGRAPPDVTIEHHYRLAAGSDAVEMETRVFSATDAGEVHDLYDALFLGGRARAFIPGHGFDAGQVATDVIATAGTTTSYGLTYPADAPPPQLLDFDQIRLAVGPNLTDNGASATRWLVIGDGSIASATESAWRLHASTRLGVIGGTAPPGVDVVVTDATGAPMTIARASNAGAFRAAVPPGAYTVHTEIAAAQVVGADTPVTVTADRDVIADVAGPVTGAIAVTAHDDGGAAIPARVILSAPGFDDRIEWVGASGAATFTVAPGAWHVAVSRGVEYDVVIADPVTVTAGATATVAATLEHVVDTSGWISLDTHLHCELSTDSTIPVDDRVRAIAAEGVEVPVASDHDYITDYTPVVAELGLDAFVGPLAGDESSSITWGHINGFPLAIDEAKTGRGAPRWLGHAPAEVFTALHAGGADRIVQVNHPRKDASSLFNAIDLDPDTLIAGRDPTSLGLPAGTDLSDLSFDAVEVANTLSSDDFEAVFADWLAMVAAGHPAAGTGSSDSHGASRFAGGARTYVWVGAGADDPATVDPAAIVDGIRARHVVVATGAFVTAGITGPTGVSLPGDTVDVAASAPTVPLHITVQAAPWQALSAIRIYQGAQQVQMIALDANDTAPVRYDTDVAMPTPAADTFFVVRVDPASEGDPVVTNTMASFTNPVFVHRQ